MQMAKDLLLCSLNALVLISTAGAQVITESPVNTTVALGTNATFSCRGDSNITWEVGNLQIRHHTQVNNLLTHQVYVPLPKPNFSELIITATNVTNDTLIFCIVGPSNGIGDNAVRSNVARLLVYGKPYPPYDLIINVKGLSLVAIWSEPFSLQGEDLSYVISINGMDEGVTVSMANYTLTGLQECAQYLVTVYSRNAYSNSINGVSRSKVFPAVPLVLRRYDIGISVMLNGGVSAKITFNSSADPCPSYPVRSNKFHVTDWYTNRLVNTTTRPSNSGQFILDDSDGLTPNKVYSLVIEAENIVGSTLSEEILFYTTGLQPPATTVMELNSSIIVTCAFAMGASSTGCQVTIFELIMDNLKEVVSKKIIRPHGFSEVEDTVDISGLVGDSTLLVDVAELLSGGGVSRALLNKTVNINVPYLSLQDNKGGGISPWILGVTVAMGIVVIILMAALIIVSIFCYRIKSSRKANTELDPDYELTPNDTYGISIEITPEETSHIHTEADGIKPIPNTVYGVSQEGDHLMQEVCSKLGDGDGTSVLSAYVAMQPNVYDTIDCLKQI